MAVAVRKPDHPQIGQLYYDGHVNQLFVWTAAGWVVTEKEEKVIEQLYELKVVGLHCNIDPDSNLHEKITNILDWMLMTWLGDFPTILTNFSELAFLDAAKPILEKDLCITIRNMKASTWLEPMQYKHIIGVALNIDQTVIDRYDEIYTENILASAINDLR